MRGRLLAAFQDLETITNEVEVHGIILRAGNKVFFIREDRDGTHVQSRLWGNSISEALSGMQLYFTHAYDVDSPMYDHSVAFLSVSHVSKMYIQHMNSTLKTSSAINK